MNNPSARIYNLWSAMSKGFLQLDNPLHVLLLSNLLIDMFGNRFNLFLCCCENPLLFFFLSVNNQLGDEENISRYSLNRCY